MGRHADPVDTVSAHDQLGDGARGVPPVHVVPELGRYVLDLVGVCCCEVAYIYLGRVQHGIQIRACPTGRIGRAASEDCLRAAPVLEVGARRAKAGRLGADPPAVHVGRNRRRLAVEEYVLLVVRVPAKQYPVGPRWGIGKVGFLRLQVPVNAVTRVAWTESPTGFGLLPRRVELVHIEHLVASGRIGVFIVLDDVRPAKLLPASGGPGWGEDVIGLRAIEAREAKLGLLPVESVGGDDVAGTVAAFRPQVPPEAVYVPPSAGQIGDGIGPVPHLEDAVLFVIQHGAAADIHARAASLPRSVGDDDRVRLVARRAMKAPGDPIAGGHHVVVEEQLRDRFYLDLSQRSPLRSCPVAGTPLFLEGAFYLQGRRA